MLGGLVEFGRPGQMLEVGLSREASRESTGVTVVIIDRLAVNPLNGHSAK